MCIVTPAEIGNFILELQGLNFLCRCNLIGQLLRKFVSNQLNLPIEKNNKLKKNKNFLFFIDIFRKDLSFCLTLQYMFLLLFTINFASPLRLSKMHYEALCIYKFSPLNRNNIGIEFLPWKYDPQTCPSLRL